MIYLFKNNSSVLIPMSTRIFAAVSAYLFFCHLLSCWPWYIFSNFRFINRETCPPQKCQWESGAERCFDQKVFLYKYAPIIVMYRFNCFISKVLFLSRFLLCLDKLRNIFNVTLIFLLFIYNRSGLTANITLKKTGAQR